MDAIENTVRNSRYPALLRKKIRRFWQIIQTFSSDIIILSNDSYELLQYIWKIRHFECFSLSALNFIYPIKKMHGLLYFEIVWSMIKNSKVILNLEL